MREGDAIAAARRRLPMVEVDAATPLIGKMAVTLLDVFEGRRMLIVIAYYFLWHAGCCARAMRGCTLP